MIRHEENIELFQFDIHFCATLYSFVLQYIILNPPSLSDHQSDDAFRFDEYVRPGHYDGIDHFAVNRLTITTAEQTFVIDDFCYLLCPHSPIG